MLRLYIEIVSWIRGTADREEGEDLIEYSMLLGLLVLFCFMAIGIASSAISTVFDTVRIRLGGA